MTVLQTMVSKRKKRRAREEEKKNVYLKSRWGQSGRSTGNINGGKCALATGWMLDIVWLQLNYEQLYNYIHYSNSIKIHLNFKRIKEVIKID